MSVTIKFLGRMDYHEALKLQQALHSQRLSGEIEDTLLLLEHPPVITLGKRGKYTNIIAPRELLSQTGVEIVETGRGGDVTYHGPGQLVGYFIVDLHNYKNSIKKLINIVEAAFISFLKKEYDIEACAGEREHTGIWVGGDKITAIGLSVSKSVTMHGFAFNVNTDLEHFKWINPCGITDKGVTSIKKLTMQECDFKKVAEAFSKEYLSVEKDTRLG